MILRPYQENAVKLLRVAFTKNKKVVFCLPTGGGKTVIFSYIAKNAIEKGKKVMILTDRIELCQQTTQTLLGLGEDVEVIRAGKKNIKPAKLYVAMVETAHRRLDRLPKCDLYIVDEAHKGNFNKIIESINDAFILGVTATPLASKKDAPMRNYYNTIVEPLVITDLIELGFLAKCTTLAVASPKGKKLKKKGGEYTDESQLAALSNGNLYGGAVGLYQKHLEGKKAICFNVNIEHSLAITKQFNEAGIPAVHVDGETDKGLRRQILRDFKNGVYRVLCNVGVATTGYDEPTIEAVIINRKTASKPLYMQMCGRGGRVIPNVKSEFIILDMANNYEEHGCWDEPFEWKKLFAEPPEKKIGGGVAPMKSCPQCLHVMPVQTMLCQCCGYEYPRKELEDGGTANHVLDVSQLVKKNWKDLDVTELTQYQKAKGYKFGWVLRQLYDRGEEAIRKFAEAKGYKQGWVDKALEKIK